jgi:hypothetical protein
MNSKNNPRNFLFKENIWVGPVLTCSHPPLSKYAVALKTNNLTITLAMENSSFRKFTQGTKKNLNSNGGIEQNRKKKTYEYK